MNDKSFYRAFEDRYRGSRDLIKERLRVYVPFVSPLKTIYEHCAAIDLGCGRGEWVELMGESGFSCQGVDLDEGMLEACRERGFSVAKKDAIEALEKLPSESQTVVSGFHIVEHISFEELQKLVKEALRVLKPAGLLVLETPNPENIIVGSSSFYSDPTHLKPLPPLLLSFLSEHTGFFRTKVLRLQESKDVKSASDINLLQVLGGVSLDYAIVAQKAASDEKVAGFQGAFEREYGVTLESLVARYESGILRRISTLEERITVMELSLRWLKAPLRWLTKRLRNK